MTPRMPHQYRRRSGSDVVSSTGRWPENSLLPGVTAASSCAFQYCSDAATAPWHVGGDRVEHRDRVVAARADGVHVAEAGRRRRPATSSTTVTSPPRPMPPMPTKNSSDVGATPLRRAVAGTSTPCTLHAVSAASTNTSRSPSTDASFFASGDSARVPRLAARDDARREREHDLDRAVARRRCCAPARRSRRPSSRARPPSWSRARGPAARRGARPGRDATRA